MVGGAGAADSGEERALLTAILVASCVLMAILFTVLASWMQDHALHRSARANLTAAACCAVSAAMVPFGGQALPATILVLAALLGAAGFHAARLGHG
jgi:protein-S-isoprenylcysteine O-methyltransferase Ste14